MRQQLKAVFMIVALPTILSLGLLFLFLRDSLNEWAIERWSNDQYAFVETLAHDIDTDIKNAAEQLKLIATNSDFTALTEIEHIDLNINGIPEHLDKDKRQAMEYLLQRGQFSVIFVLTPEGEHYISHPFSVQRSLKKYNLSDRPYFKQAKATKKLTISDSFVGADGIPAVAINLPILDAKGDIKMYLGGVFHLRRISDFLAKHRIAPFELAVLRDRNNKRIAESVTSRISAPMLEPLLSYFRSANDGVITNAFEQKYNTQYARFSDSAGDKWLAYDATLTWGWHLVLFRSEASLISETLSKVRKLTFFTALIVLFPGLLGLGLATSFYKRWVAAREKLFESHHLLEQKVQERTRKLELSEIKHRTLFESSADGILILDGDRFIDCNPAAVKLFGAVSRDKLLECSPWELTPITQPKLGDSKKAAQSEVKKAMDEGFSDFEWLHSRLDNEKEFTARVLLTRMTIDSRVLIQVSIRDITDRKQAEKLLQLSHLQNEEMNQKLTKTIERLNESENNYSKLFKFSRDGYVINKGSGELVKSNPAYLDILGYASSDELTTLNWQKATPKEWLDWELEHQAPLLMERGYTDLYEKEYIRKDGSRVAVEVQAYLLDKNDNLDESVIAAFVRNITERKRAEEALRTSEQRFRDICLASADWVWEVDANARYTYASENVFSLLGFRVDEIIGKTPFDLMPSDEAKRISENFSKIATNKETFHELENINIHKDGSLRILSTSGVPIIGADGELLGYRGMDRDITEEKNAQEVIEKRLLTLTQPLNENVAFDELFNLSEIQHIQDDFALATGVASIITSPDGTPITAPSNFTKLCHEIIRKTDKGCKNCFKSDAIIGRENPDGPTIQPCLSGGLWDAGTSIMVGGRHVANWLIGQVRNEKQTKEAMLKYAREIGADENLFIEAFNDVPRMSLKKFESIAKALHTLANNMSKSAYQTIQQARYITAQKRIDNLLSFIAQHGEKNNRDTFLPNLAQKLGEELQVDYVIIDQLSETLEEAETVGLYAHGKVIPNFNYGLAGTPCENVVGKSVCVYSQGIQQKFPEDTLLVDMKAESYMGVPLWDSKGQAIGLIAIIDSEPIADSDEPLKLLNLVSTAASSELERLRDEKTLREERDRAQGYLDTVEAIIVALNTEGIIVRINRKACQLLGWQETELVGKNWFDKCLPQDMSAKVKTIFTGLIEGETENVEYYESQVLTRTGKLLDIAWHNSVLRQDDGKIVGTLNAGEDITARKQTEHALRRAQKMEAIGQLTGGIAHDFNNILGIIIGNLELLTYRTSDDDSLNYVETAKQSALRATDLTKQLLGFSRQESTQLAPTDIRQVITEMDSLIIRSLTPQITVDKFFVEDLWLTNIDAGDFKDALINLVINARDAMPSGGKLTLELNNCVLDEVYCAQNPGAEQGEYVELAVSDNGQGIDQKHKEKIFEPFFTTKAQGKGTGLGLAMVYGFTKRSSGYIKFYSEKDIGTTIRLYLPKAKDQTPLPPQKPKQAEQLPRGTESIMVVDDEAALLKLGQQLLEGLGYRVVIASSGQEAMEKLIKEPSIDLLFSDVVMPGGMTGYELVEQATKIIPHLKVLLTSGYTGKATQQNELAHIDAPLLSKPYNQAELAQAVRKVLGDPDVSKPERHEPNDVLVQPSNVSHEWNDSLSIGIDEIDEDHKVLVELLNRSQQAMERKDSKDRIQQILSDLCDYVQSHFQREETVMAAVDYPGFMKHCQVHKLLIKQVENKQAAFERGELSIEELTTLIYNWLVDHINVMDFAIAPYCKGKEQLIKQALEKASISLTDKE